MRRQNGCFWWKIHLRNQIGLVMVTAHAHFSKYLRSRLFSKSSPHPLIPALTSKHTFHLRMSCMWFELSLKVDNLNFHSQSEHMGGKKCFRSGIFSILFFISLCRTNEAKTTSQSQSHHLLLGWKPDPGFKILKNCYTPIAHDI